MADAVRNIQTRKRLICPFVANAAPWRVPDGFRVGDGAGLGASVKVAGSLALVVQVFETCRRRRRTRAGWRRAGKVERSRCGFDLTVK